MQIEGQLALFAARLAPACPASATACERALAVLQRTGSDTGLADLAATAAAAAGSGQGDGGALGVEVSIRQSYEVPLLGGECRRAFLTVLPLVCKTCGYEVAAKACVYEVSAAARKKWMGKVLMVTVPACTSSFPSEVWHDCIYCSSIPAPLAVP